MDSALTAPKLAADLGISLPRVHRLLDAEGVEPAAGRGHVRAVDPTVARRLARRVGAVPQRAGDLDRVDMLVLAAVSRAALGLESVRAVARASRVSPTAAGKSLEKLERRGLVKRISRRVVQGRPRSLSLWFPGDAVDRDPELADAISKVRLPDRPGGESDRRPRTLPRRFHHLFWGGDPRRLDLRRDSDFIAFRLMAADDPDAWAWAVANLPRSSLRKAATMRGMTPRRRALTSNLIEN